MLGWYKRYRTLGTRIKLDERHNMQNLLGLYAVPFVALSVYLAYELVYVSGLYQDIINQGKWQDMRLMLVILPLLVGALLLLYVTNERFFLVDYLRHCRNRQMIATRLYDDKMYQTQIRKSLFFDREIERIVKYPKIFYQVNGSFIKVSFATDFTTWQHTLETLADELAIALYSDVYEKVFEDGYVVFNMLYAPEKMRVLITDITPTDKKIQLMKHAYWTYNEIPHCLVSGGTGSGKTFMMLALLYSFIKIGADVVILDPKKTDLSYLKTIPALEHLVSCQTEEMLTSLRLFYEAMLDRQVEFDQLANKRTGLIYSDVGLNPVVLLFDEYSAFIGSLDYAERRNAEKWLNQIILLGRQLGFFVILGMQRADGSDLDTKLRDQFGLRVALGGMSQTGYAMMFNDNDKKYMSKLVQGFGYAAMGTNDVREFYSPFVPKGFNFVDEIGKIYREREK